MREGDWVCVRFDFHTYFGYANKLYDGQDAFQMCILKRVDKKGSQHFHLGKYKMLYQSQAELIEVEHSADDYATLIDLALMNRDREWFNELVGRASLKTEEPLDKQEHDWILQGMKKINKIIAAGFAALGQALRNAFSFIRERFTGVVDVIKLYKDKCLERIKQLIELRKDWWIKVDTREHNQVLAG
ncbi:IDEAL domain-containing protein [Domibacillus sp. PGB-M46]|uniref:IDEAL domain-containing protein n=1 Tax=Domibacillus sp. PGB-M46 TaxID=2910255 RepID=UPI001F5745FE|nr:IDEAL domain-containing protein [Domibacillus sp. PGB-M46]MCI2255220.1 IDEAL domain-containing protein [Domibacillus sp. PGB-M46]